MDIDSQLYRNKYLKYKQKYLEIKAIKEGGMNFFGSSNKSDKSKNNSKIIQETIKLAQEKSKEEVKKILDQLEPLQNQQGNTDNSSNKGKKLQLFSNEEKKMITKEFEDLFDSKSGDIIKKIKDHTYNDNDTASLNLLKQIIDIDAKAKEMFNKGLDKVHNLLENDLTTKNIDDIPQINASSDVEDNIKILIQIKNHFKFIEECKKLELLQHFNKCDRNKIDLFKKYSVILKQIQDHSKELKTLVNKYNNEVDIQGKKLIDNIQKIKILPENKQFIQELNDTFTKQFTTSNMQSYEDTINTMYNNNIDKYIKKPLNTSDAITDMKTLKLAIYNIKNDPPVSIQASNDVAENVVENDVGKDNK